MKQFIFTTYNKLPWHIQEKIKFIKYLYFYNSKKFQNFEVLKSQPKKTIIILGMHRSGTSVTANILHALGVDLGTFLLNSADDNKKGFYENRDFVFLNNHLLAKAGGMWHSPPSQYKINKLLGQKSIEKKIINVINRNQNEIWGWKDPRTILTLPLYLPFIKNPYFIICYRDGLSVAESLHKRDNFKLKDGINLTKIYHDNLKEFLKKFEQKRILKIKFNDLIENENNETKRIKEFLGLKKKITTVVDKSLACD